MSVVTVANGAEQTREGLEVKTKEAFTFTLKSLAEYIKYLLGPKDNHDIIDPYVRTRHMKCNFSGLTPPKYGTENFHEDLKNKSSELANQMAERQKVYSKINPKRSHKKNKDPIAYEIILSMVDEEIAGLTEEEIAARMYECGDFIVKGITGNKEIINDVIMKPHIKYDPKREGKLMPDMHILIGYYDYQGNALNLGADCGISKLAEIHYAMENHKDFKFLLKTRTNAWEEQGKNIPAAEVKVVTDKIDEIVEKYQNKPGLMHKAFKEAGIKLEPHHNGKSKGISYIKVTYEGKTYRTLNKNFNPETTASLRKYFDQKDFEENYPKIAGAEFGVFNHLYNQMNSIFKKYENKPLIELTDALLSKGIIATPFLKNGKINGMSFTLPKNDKKQKSINIKAYALDFDYNSYTYNDDEIQKILTKAKDFKNKKYVALGADEQIIIDGEIYKVDSLGNLYKVEKTAKEKKEDFVQWMKWLKADDETLPEFQNRMIFSKNNKQTFLKSVYFKGEDFTTAYNHYNGLKAFEIKENGVVTICQNNTSSIKASLQAYAAMNQISDEDKINGFKPAIKLLDTKDGVSEMNNKIWLEARLMGFVVNGYEPPKSVVEQYENKLKEKLDYQRKENARRLTKLAAMPVEEQGKKKLTLSYYKALENDVDRRAMAYACVDAFIMGVDLDLLKNPPKCHQESRNRLLDHDIEFYKEIMLAEMKKLCPEKYDEFYKNLYGSDDGKYKPKIKHKI